MTKKKKIISNLVYLLTLLLPTSIFLIVSATILHIKPDFYIDNVETFETLYLENEAFLYSHDVEVEYIGKVSYNADLDTFGVLLREKELVKVKNKYYEYKEGEVVEISVFKLEKKESWKIPIPIFISAFAVVVGVLVIIGKMGWVKKVPRIATLLSLVLATGVLFAIDLIASNMAWVFLTLTVSWAMYLIEYTFVRLSLSSEEKRKEKDNVLGQLRDLLR